jgi:hypothetical protein
MATNPRNVIAPTDPNAADKEPTGHVNNEERNKKAGNKLVELVKKAGRKVKKIVLSASTD